MQLLFSNFTICPASPAFIGYQYDNLTDVLQVLGTIPTGWSWVVMVQSGTNLNIIPLDQGEDGSLSVTLTAEMIPLTGYYTMQLRATQGDLVKYTNQFQAYVGASLSGDAQWPTIPTEFTEIEQNILDLNQHPPYPGSNGYWMIWNTAAGRYEESTLQTGSGGSDKTFNFSQNVPSTVWYVEHNLGKYPSVSVVDSGNNVVVGDVTYVDDNNLKIQFSSAFSGKAYMN